MPTTRIADEDQSSSHYLTKPVADVHYLNQQGDRIAGDLDMNNHKLKNADLDNCTVSTKLDMRNNIDMNGSKIVELGAPTSDRNAATKKYVDTQVNSCLLTTGDLDVSGRRVQNVGAPTENTDAATKGYVDNHVKVIPFRYVSAAIMNSVTRRKHIFTLTGIDIPPVQHSTQVYVTATLRSLRISFNAFLYVNKKIVTGPRGGPNKVNIEFLLSLEGGYAEDIGISFGVTVVVDGFIMIGPQTELDYLPSLEPTNPDIFPDDSDTYILTPEAQQALST